MRQGMNNESILVEYTLYLITDQSLVSSILMIFCTAIQTYYQLELRIYHPKTFLDPIKHQCYCIALNTCLIRITLQL
jgi:hypothetical protein